MSMHPAPLACFYSATLACFCSAVDNQLSLIRILVGFNYVRLAVRHTLLTREVTGDDAIRGRRTGMSRSLLNIEKRTLPRWTLRGVGLASKDAVG